MKANTYIRIKDENPKRVKEDIISISTMISQNNYNSFPFIEITEIVSYVHDLEFEEKRHININFITSFESLI